MVVYSEIRIKQINLFCRHIVEFLNVKPIGTYTEY